MKFCPILRGVSRKVHYGFVFGVRRGVDSLDYLLSPVHGTEIRTFPHYQVWGIYFVKHLPGFDSFSDRVDIQFLDPSVIFGAHAIKRVFVGDDITVSLDVLSNHAWLGARQPDAQPLDGCVINTDTMFVYYRAVGFHQLHAANWAGSGMILRDFRMHGAYPGFVIRTAEVGQRRVGL